jgi:hypothetical protein
MQQPWRGRRCRSARFGGRRIGDRRHQGTRRDGSRQITAVIEAYEESDKPLEVVLFIPPMTFAGVADLFDYVDREEREVAGHNSGSRDTRRRPLLQARARALLDENGLSPRLPGHRVSETSGGTHGGPALLHSSHAGSCGYVLDTPSLSSLRSNLGAPAEPADTSERTENRHCFGFRERSLLNARKQFTRHTSYQSAC